MSLFEKEVGNPLPIKTCSTGGLSIEETVCSFSCPTQIAPMHAHSGLFVCANYTHIAVKPITPPHSVHGPIGKQGCEPPKGTGHCTAVGWAQQCRGVLRAGT